MSITFSQTGEPAGGTCTSDEKPPSVGDTVWLRVLDAHTCYYKDEELVA